LVTTFFNVFSLLLLVSYIPWFYEVVLPRYSSRTQRFFYLTKALMKEIKAFCKCVTFYFFDLSKKDPKNVNVDEPSILLIHGYLHNSSAWTDFKKWFHKEGIKNVFTINLGHPFQKIEDYAQKINNKRAEIEALTGNRNIILIGHSMGGVVAVEAALQSQEGILGIFTLASPLKGSYRGPWGGIGECHKQTQLHSPYIQELYARIHKANLSLYHLATEGDLIVRPIESAFHTPSPKQTILLKDLGHVSLLFSKRVFYHTYDSIKTLLTTK